MAELFHLSGNLSHFPEFDGMFWRDIDLCVNQPSQQKIDDAPLDGGFVGEFWISGPQCIPVDRVRNVTILFSTLLLIRGRVLSLIKIAEKIEI